MFDRLMNLYRENVGTRRSSDDPNLPVRPDKISLLVDDLADAVSLLRDVINGSPGRPQEQQTDPITREDTIPDSESAEAVTPEQADPVLLVDTSDNEATESKLTTDSVTRALRMLKRPDRLAKCDLVDRIPLLMLAASGSSVSDVARSLTSFEKIHAIRKILEESIEALKPDGFETDTRSPQAECFVALSEQYLVGRPVSQITRRLCLSERTYYHRRRAGIEIITADLASREMVLRQANGSDTGQSATTAHDRD